MTILECGLDEAGRGPLAGPVTAGCVILPEDFPFEILNDSKKMTEKKREAAEKLIKEKACWAVSFVDEKKIDEINILQASMLAMKNAYDEMLKKLPLWLEKNGFNLSEKIEITAIADGTNCPEVSCSVRCEPKADGKYSEVMAASILAKVARDRLMLEYDKKYPEYGYAEHKGYPTTAHREVCRKIGTRPTPRVSVKY